MKIGSLFSGIGGLEMAELGHIEVGPYASKTDAATKAIAMVDAALSYGGVGDFVGLADGSFRRMRVGEMVIDDV